MGISLNHRHLQTKNEPGVRASLALGLVTAACLALSPARAQPSEPIDRLALLRRHNPHLTSLDSASPLTLGNGQFAFTADITGLQTFGSLYETHGIPLGTMARWAWYEEPNPHAYRLADTMEEIRWHEQPVPFPTRALTAPGQWLRRNPRDFPLGVLGFAETTGAPLLPADLSAVDQTLDLWSGELHSRFHWRGAPVEVSTAVTADDTVLVEAASAELAPAGRLRLLLSFPRGYDERIKNTPPLDWSAPQSHRTEIQPVFGRGLVFRRSRDNWAYDVVLNAQPSLRAVPVSGARHRFLLAPAAKGTGRVRLALRFALPGPASLEAGASPALDDGRWTSAALAWHRYWRTSAMIDFSGSTDPRAAELERRLVLSQYLLAAQYRGDVPPSETGLTASSWYGKHNTEMVWWHVAHFALWGHPEATAQALEWYRRTLPVARERARAEGLAGARWPKMCGPEGRESPGGNPLIVWNQPHPIALAELLYRADPGPVTLARWQELVEATAECLCSMLTWNPASGRYDLGPPLWIAQEIYDPKTTRNPAFELAYWRYALETAQIWRVRTGGRRNPEWDRRLRLLAPLPIREGRYVATESTPDTWTNLASRSDHPSFLMALGPVPNPSVDRTIMRRTLAAVVDGWNWEKKIWGWDYPMMAMTATRLNEPRLAVELLLRAGPSNEYLPNGNCRQRSDLPLYLPANGALLSAAALMVAGWDGSPPQPGIPQDGTWRVRAEGLHPLP